MLIMRLVGDSDNPRNIGAHLKKHSVIWLLQLIQTLYKFSVPSYQLLSNYPRKETHMSFKGLQFSTSKAAVYIPLKVHCMESA